VAALALVNIGANPVIFGASVFANTVALTNGGSNLTLNNGVTVNGAITTTAGNNTGILVLNPDSDVTGTIGANGAALNQVNIGAGAAAFGANVWANAVQLTNAASVLTLNNATVNGAITNTSGNNNSGTLILNPGSSVTGTIGANGAALAAVNIAGEAAFEANVWANAVQLTNGASALTLNNGVTVNGAITTTANNNGSLTFNGNSSVNGTIGANGAALNTVTFDGVTTLAQPSFSQTFTVSNGANVKGNALMTGAVTLAGNGILDATVGGVAGSVAAAGGTFKGNVVGSGSVGVGGTFTGNVSTSATIAGGVFTGNAGTSVTISGGQFTGNAGTTATISGGVFTGNANSVVISGGQFIGDVVTTVNFTGVGTVKTTNVGGQIDFGGSGGTVTVNDGGTLATVTSNSAAAAGNLVFLEGGTVTGKVSNIGPITLNTLNGANKIINFQQDVSAASLTFANASTANLQGSLTTGNVDFNNTLGVLEFSGTTPPTVTGYTLNSPIANGDNGTLNVYTTNTNLTATNSSIGTVQTINIGQNTAPAAFTVDVSNKALTLGSTINLNDTASAFALTTSNTQQVTFANSVDGFAGGGGSVNLSSTNGAKLVIQGSDNTKTLGKVGAALAAINVTAGSEVGVVGGANSLNVSNTAVLNIAAGGVFADASLTSAQIGTINIGDATAGPAVYALDAINTDFDLDAPGVEFKNDSSVLKLMTSAAAAGTTSTIYLTGNIEPLNKNTAIVELNAQNAGVKLIINGTKNDVTNKGYSLGTVDKPLQQIKFSGQGEIEVTAINTPSIDVSVAKIAIGSVEANVVFSPPSGSIKTELGAVKITGNMNFQNVAATAIFASDIANSIPAAITGNITSTGGGNNGTVIFMDNGTIGTVDGNGNSTNTITNLAMLQAGKDNSTVTVNAGGNMSIAEIQGTGTGDIVFTQPTDLTGNINQTGGSAVNLTFNNGGSILGNAGSNTAIGDITILDGTLSLGVPASVPDSVFKGNAIYLGPSAIVKFDSSNISFDVYNYVAPNPFNILAAIPITGGMMYNDNDPETDNKQRGQSNSPIGIIQVNGNDVTLTNQVYVNNVKFTSPQSVTLTLANTSTINESITTTGNKIHTLAISNDLITGASGSGSVGSDSNHLKTVQFNGVDSKITIDSEDFYSSITTKTNNQGTAIFNANNGFTDDLGGENLSLKLVQFSSNKGTVKGDTYAKNITIDAGKSAVFTGYNSRSLDIPSATVGGVKVPRATTKFNYKTKIVSDSFKGSSSNSSAEYTNAVLLQAPINGGSHKFNDDVWLQKPVTGTNNITFAPKKTAFIQSDLVASTIVADQATMMFTGDNASVNVGGNISGSNITFDLGNNKVTYTGSATPTGVLTIKVFYDTTNAGQTGNTNSGNIVLASGSTVDLSNVTSILVDLTAQNDPSAIGQGSAYPIITSASDGIIVGNAANLPFNVTANEGGFVRWQITNGSFVLLPIEPTGDVTVDNIIGKIIKAPPGSDAAKVAHVLVNTPVGQRPAVVRHLLPIIERPSIEIHRITTPLITPMGPSVGPSIGGFSPIQPPPTTGNVVNNIYVPPTIPGGYDVQHNSLRY